MLGHAELSTTQIYAQVSIRALQAVHRATHPGALRPVPSTRRTNDSGVDDEGEPEQFISTLRASPRELLAAALESEIEEENRAPAGSNGDPS
jgi:integrase/recombinase XerD